MSNSSRQNFLDTVNHKQPEKVVVDFGSTGVTGIHALIVEKLRNYYGLEQKPVKIIEPYQMLGEIDPDLLTAMDIEIVGLIGLKNMFGIANDDWKQHRTIWGQEVLLPGNFNYTYNTNGDVLIYPEGEHQSAPVE